VADPVVSTPLVEVAVGLLSLIVIILVHGVSMRIINRRFSRAWIHVHTGTPHWRINLLLAAVIASLAAVHLFETLMFAVPLQMSGIIPDLRDSYYYVLESYTTLGEGNQNLPEEWRLIGPIIAMAGLFTFGWTGSVLVSIMTQFGRLDSAQATKGQKDRDQAQESGTEP
jgi:hypothetical protein